MYSLPSPSWFAWSHTEHVHGNRASICHRLHSELYNENLEIGHVGWLTFPLSISALLQSQIPCVTFEELITTENVPKAFSKGLIKYRIDDGIYCTVEYLQSNGERNQPYLAAQQMDAATEKQILAIEQRKILMTF